MLSEKKDSGYKFAIRGTYLQDIKMNGVIPPDLVAFGSGDDKVQYEHNFNMSYRQLNDVIYEVVLNIKYTAKNLAEQALYTVEIKYACIVEYGGNKSDLHYIVFVKVPEVIFPYARSFLMNFITQAGYKPMNVAMMNFEEMYEKNKAKATPVAQPFRVPAFNFGNFGIAPPKPNTQNNNSGGSNSGGNSPPSSSAI